MSVRGRLLLAASGLLCVTLCQAAPDFAGVPASEDARFAAEQVLGAALGDRIVVDAELRIPGRPTLDERTTPAGRFESQPGRNDKGEPIVWIDYQASLAIHRLRAAPAAERRAERLASPARDDKRISLGCVVVPVEFYESVVGPSLGRGRGVVYVLPETRPARALFDAATVAGTAGD